MSGDLFGQRRPRRVMPGELTIGGRLAWALDLIHRGGGRVHLLAADELSFLQDFAARLERYGERTFVTSRHIAMLCGIEAAIGRVDPNLQRDLPL